MKNCYYDKSLIEQKEKLIEEKRLQIKDLKHVKIFLHNKMEIIGNIYQYVMSPLCAISIIFASIFSGVWAYIVPIVAALLAIGAITSKFALRKRIDKLNTQIKEIKDERQNCYDEREQLYETMFNDLYNKKMDEKDFYHQIVTAQSKCNDLTKIINEHKIKKDRLDAQRKIVSRLFDYILAPIGAIVLPIVCSFLNLNEFNQALVIIASSGTLLGFATIDKKLTNSINTISDEISEIKADRTVCYVKRDIKLKESLKYLDSIKV